MEIEVLMSKFICQMLLKKALLLMPLLFLLQSDLEAQQGSYEDLVYQIDSLAIEGLPKSALKKVDDLDKLSRKSQHPSWQIKAAVYQMTFQSYLEEDALVGIVNRLKKDINEAQFPVKSVLQSILAETYWKYYKSNRYAINQRVRLTQPDEDFTRWDTHTITNEVSGLYKLSLSESEKLQTTSIKIFKEVLKGDSSSRYLRPTLYDLLAHRALDFYIEEESSLSKPKLSFSINQPVLFSRGDMFSKLAISTPDTSSTIYQGLLLLQRLTKFHLASTAEEAVTDIDLRRLEFLYRKAVFPEKDSLYLSVLQEISKAQFSNPISAEVLFRLGQYYKQKDSLQVAASYLKLAVRNFPESIGGKNAFQTMQEIERKELSVQLETTYIPNKPILALLNYRNTKKVSVKVFSIAYDKDLLQFQRDKRNIRNNNHFVPTVKLVAYLKNIKPVQEQQLFPVGIDDYKRHSAEFKMESLQAGRYLVLIEDDVDSTLTQVAEFNVSNLSFVNRFNDKGEIEIKVFNRNSGLALSGIAVSVSQSLKDTNNTIKISEGHTNQEGLFVFRAAENANLTYMLNLSADTLIGTNNVVYGGTISKNTIEKSKVEQRTTLFTDRQLYRPGQTIYFKGLQIKSTKDGDSIVPGADLEIYFKAENRKTIASSAYRTNEYGTFTGSFVIPANILNGRFEISTTHGNVYVRVEDYKRPTFNITFNPVKETYRFDDSVVVHGKVTAFAGYGLSNAKVSYSIFRTTTPGDFRTYMWIRNGRPVQEIINFPNENIQADKNGNFVIAFKAAVDRRDRVPGAIYTYNITATVTSTSGETKTAKSFVTVGTEVIRVNALMSSKVVLADTLRMPVSLSNLNGQAQEGSVRTRIYALKAPDQMYKRRLWQEPDKYFLDKEVYRRDFPLYAYKGEDDYSKWEIEEVVFDKTVLITENQPAFVTISGLKDLTTAVYFIEINARNSQGDTCSNKFYTTFVTDKISNPAGHLNWALSNNAKIKKGKNATFFLGIGKPATVLMEVFDSNKLVSSENLKLGELQSKVEVPYNGENDLRVQFLMISDNRIYSHAERIVTAEKDNKLDLRFETFRNRLQPGEKEQWKLKVTNSRQEGVPAEMVATLYDASLNELSPKKPWVLRYIQYPSYFAYSNWQSYRFGSSTSSRPVFNHYYRSVVEARKYEVLDMPDFSYSGWGKWGYQSYLDNISAAIKEKEYVRNAALVKGGFDVSGTIMKNNTPLAQVVVNIKSSSIKITTDALGYFKIKVPYQSELIFSYPGYISKTVKPFPNRNLTVNLSPTASELKDIIITVYGTQRKSDLTGAINEMVGSVPVLEDNTVHSFASMEISPQEIPFMPKVPPANIIRKNFNETAFFYPQLRTNTKGEVLVEFTIPDALTRWQFKALAHTKDLSTGYLESEIITQKQLMISANAPRFLREGDTITISAQVANLQDQRVKAKVEIFLFDAMTMQPLKLLVNSMQSAQTVELAANANKAVSFKMVVPSKLAALTYRLTAKGAKHQDGEENNIPVLPNRMLVTESMPMTVRAGARRTFEFKKLVNQQSGTLEHKSLTLEYTANPAWNAIQALPYLMEVPYECSEQIFGRFYANSLSTAILKRYPQIEAIFNRWKSGNSEELLSKLEKNKELKTILIEETPWLRDAENETEQKKRIALLFDLNKMSYDLDLDLDKLLKIQLPDGSFPWFAGAGDKFITQHILAGIGQLYQTNVVDSKNQKLTSLKDKLLGYLDKELKAEYERINKKVDLKQSAGIDPLSIHAWYTRSYFTEQPLTDDLKRVRARYLEEAETGWKFVNVYQQALIALTFKRYNKMEQCQKILNSLKETAQYSDELGMYWVKNQLGYFWYQSPIETQALLIELFSEVGNSRKEVGEMKVWLLRNKQASNWKSTKATAAACYALLTNNAHLAPVNTDHTILIGGEALKSIKPDIEEEAGSGYIKTSWKDEKISPALGSVAIENKGETLNWGALHWQYLERFDKISRSETGLKLERKYFIQRTGDHGPVLSAISSQNIPAVGDLLKVVIYITADRDYEYVHLKDMRPSGTEPTDVVSGYTFKDGLFYYRVIKDVSTNFFLNNVPKGKYVFEYDLRVSQSGTFSTGISTIQSLYAPEFSAHSAGVKHIYK